jgi:hypothetical protein
MSARYIDITINNIEYMHAAHAGFLREAANVLAERYDTNAGQRDAYSTHILGAVGEYVAARALDIFWAGPGRLRAPDVGPLQIRTGTKHTHSLILHPSDADDDVFVLVTGSVKHYRVHGWIYGRDGKRREYWKDPDTGRPAFFVPQSALNDIADLPAVKPAGLSL